MKNLFYFLTLFVFLNMCSADLLLADDKNINLTQEQIEFADLLTLQLSINKAEWQTTSSLLVQIDPKTLKLDVKDPAKLIAQNIAMGGLEYTQKDICVNVYVDPSLTLASACESDYKAPPLSQNQKAFAKKISEESGVLYVKWINTYELDITYDILSSASLKKNENLAKLNAISIATEAYLYTEQNTCVKLNSLEFGQLAYECMGEQTET